MHTQLRRHTSLRGESTRRRGVHVVRRDMPVSPGFRTANVYTQASACFTADMSGQKRNAASGISWGDVRQAFCARQRFGSSRWRSGASRARHRAAVVFRGERTGAVTLAERADRALRTLVARRCAAEAYDFARRLAISTRSEALPAERVLERLASRPCWRRVTPRQLVCSFGSRRAVLTVEHSIVPPQLASMIARTEIRVLLGDSDSGLVAHLQTFAGRELVRLATAT